MMRLPELSFNGMRNLLLVSLMVVCLLFLVLFFVSFSYDDLLYSSLFCVPLAAMFMVDVES
jgi:FtsH-binding integral membrane protein